MKTKWIEEIFCKTQEQLKEYLFEVLKKTHGESNIINEDGFLYAKGTHPVLLVAHLDTVHKQLPREIFYNRNRTKMLSFEGIGGDDRCGVIIILSILKNINCSVVFCEDEETGCIGAKKFCKKDIDLGVNYAVEFDRKGNNDYVFYKDYNADFENHIKSFGFKKAHGSCSDITHIAPAFKIEAVNISSGYYSPHTTNEYVDFVDVCDIIRRATNMIATETKKFEYIEEKEKPVFYYPRNYFTFNEEDNRPLRLTDKDVRLFIKGDEVVFKYLWLDASDNIYLDDSLKKKVQFAKIERKNSIYAATYFSLRYSYKDQMMTYAQYVKTEKYKQKHDNSLYCAICGEKIDKKDSTGAYYQMCKECREKYGYREWGDLYY